MQLKAKDTQAQPMPGAAVEDAIPNRTNMQHNISLSHIVCIPSTGRPAFRLPAVSDSDDPYQSWESAYGTSRCDCFAIPAEATEAEGSSG